MKKLSECEKGYRRWISPSNKPEKPKMNKFDKLNQRVAKEVLGWQERTHINPLKHRIVGWYDHGTYMGLWDNIPDWSRRIDNAFCLLARHCWSLTTCDAGYQCAIHTAPEDSEKTLGHGVGDSVPEAICKAVLDAQPRIKRLRKELSDMV